MEQWSLDWNQKPNDHLQTYTRNIHGIELNMDMGVSRFAAQMERADDPAHPW